MSTISKRRKTALEVIEAYNAWDIERIMAYRAEDCTQLVAPATLQREPLPNAAYRAYFSTMMPLFQNFTVTIHQLVEDAAANTVAIWASSVAETAIGPYANEYTLLLSFSESGEKVTRIVEFVDSAYSKDFFVRLGEWAAAKRAREGSL